MSGGSLEYVSSRVDEAIERIRQEPDALYKAFICHLELVSKALHEVEWALSADTRKGEADYEAILKCINGTDVRKALKEDIEHLARLIELAQKFVEGE